MKLGKYVFMGLAVLALVLTGCSGEDGKDGVDGIDGTTGPAGPIGPAGADGANGVDGNANVQKIDLLFDDPTGETSISFDIPEITEDVLINDGLLFYLYRTFNENQNDHYSVPGIGFNGAHMVGVITKVGGGEFFFKDFDGNDYALPASSYTGGKLIIVESTNTEASKYGKGGVLAELKAAGVDVNDYNAVVAYFNLN